MKKVSFKKAIQIVWPNATDIKLTKGYFYCSGFFDVDGQTYYISTGDLRTNLGIMYRTAKDRKDYTGGINQWGFESILKEKGYVVGSIPHQCY
ncbi:MAG: hypothetical protein J6S85_10495 [Methanobrevibacter sp.]|nr:hypothetical protein [Methanobrevibacter sp.]